MIEQHEELRSRLYRDYRYRDNVPAEGLAIEGRPALTGIDPALVGDYVILTVRDPLCSYDADPVEVIASRLDDPQQAGSSGMFSSWTGTYRGARITVVSGGSGAPEAELAMHELLQNTEASTFMRVGGAGGMHPAVNPGDVVVASGVVRGDGMTAAYVPASWPAVCSPEVVLALAAAAHSQRASFEVGLIRSTDSDFVDGGRPGVGGFMQPWHMELVDSWTRAGVLAGDRESSAIVTLATLFGRRGASICSVADNIATGAPFRAGAGHDVAISVALEGLAILHQMDSARAAAGAPMWLPTLDLGTSRNKEM